MGEKLVLALEDPRATLHHRPLDGLGVEEPLALGHQRLVGAGLEEGARDGVQVVAAARLESVRVRVRSG